MSQQLFEVSGISLDNTISILYGVEVPGASQDTNDAPQGSVYFTTDGVTWKKIAVGSGIDKWSQSAGGGVVSGINSLRNVTGNTVVDSLNSADIDTGVWAITTSSVTNPLDHQTVIVTGSHNTAVAKYSLYSRMDFGTKIQGITYDVRLNSGKFELVVFAPTFCNIDCYRLNAISNGSTVTLVTSGGGSGGGTGDVTTSQLNAEISSRIAGDLANSNSITSAIASEATARAAADSALDTKISGKADITGLATQFTNINTNITIVSEALAAETAARIAGDSSGGSGSVSTVNYNFAVDVLGIPVSNSLVGSYVSPGSFDLSGAGVAKALSPATAQAVFTLKKNDTTIGTVTFAAGSTTGIVTVTPTSIVTNDELSLWSPTVTDDTLSDVAITFIGSGTSSGGGTSAPQVNADWNASSGVAEILNKPLLPKVSTYLGDYTNDVGYQTAADLAVVVDSITAEATARQAADTALHTTLQAIVDTDLANEATARTAADTALQTSINTEVAARISADAALQAAIDASISGAITPEQLAAAIAALPSDAAQIPSDWNATSGAAQILNKPTIPIVPTIVSAFTNDSGYQTVAQVGTLVNSVVNAAIAAIPTPSQPVARMEFSVSIFGVPMANQIVGMQLIAASCSFGTGFAKAITAPTNAASFILKVNGTQVGTIDFAVGATEGVISSLNLTLHAGDFIQLLAPSVIDDTLSDIAIMLIGTYN